MLIYISGPYTPKDDRTIEANIAAARRAAIAVWESGNVALCPHLNTAHFEVDCKCTYEDYIDGDIVLLTRCDAILMIDGWETSKGAVYERDEALRMGIPVYYWPDVPGLHLTERRSPKQVKAFCETVNRMYRTHLDKNADYSPANVLLTGQIGVATRLWDKIARILNLIGFRLNVSVGTFEAPREAKHESLADSFLDAAVYSIIGLLMLEDSWGK